MGVPKFYRWISERYPCLSQVIKEYQIPEFDNMYLDMNGIIHPCSHPNDEDAHFRITEKEIFQNIFNYIECVFRLIKPKKLFFMAVDGVAPRAKMNQQRARRFRSALDAEAQKQDAIAKGETLPEQEKFDSNCITPGTEFMCKLHEQLKYFVNKKMSSDPAWQKVKVILSGHNVPGEGEHKITEYLRYSQQQPDYDPNTRHCLYGLDADLMFLGLATHELHFSLLREEVKFGKTQKRITAADEQCFHLLHVSLFREYIDKEFQCLKEALGEEYDLERIIDDFILMSFLVGNDFIPHLPDFHIHAGSLPILWKTYKEVRPNLDGYLHEHGNMDMKRFATYLEVLSRFDMERFEVQYEDLKWMAGKAEQRKSKTDKQSETDRLKEKFGAMMMLDSEEDAEEEDSDEEKDMIQNEFKIQKKRYYMGKFKKTKSEVPNFMLDIGFKYVEGLNWILLYYFQGVPSWSWFYPYHYAPYLSDLQNVAEMQIDLQLSEAFSPFQQLMAVLPPGSSKLLPAVLQELYTDPSPITDFYPPTFETDLNGKKQEWEAVVLIPFIDEVRLIGAMEEPIAVMTDDEKARNTHGPCIIGCYDETVKDLYPSSFPTVFPDIQPSHTRIEQVHKYHFRVSGDKLLFKVPDKSADPFRMGFPSARHLKHTAEFEAAGCKIFQFGSKDANCILTIDPQTEKPLEEYKALIGETVYVEYPHLVEALVIGVHTEEHNYLLEGTSIVKKPAIQGKKDCFKHLKSRECITLKSRWGLEVGDVKVMYSVQKIRGKVPSFNKDSKVEVVKHWCEEKTYVPGQLVLSGVATPLPVQEKCENLTLEGVFPQDAKVFVVSNPGYGSLGRILTVEDNRIKVQLVVDDEPMLDKLRTALDEHDENWYFPREICGKLGISPLLLSKITSAFKIAIANKNGVGNSHMNIGLNIKYASKCLMAPEYSRKIDNGGWQYSDTLYKILKDYVDKFPDLFTELEEHLKKDMINASEIASKLGPEFNVRKYLEEIKVYLKTLPVHNAKLVGVGSELIGSKHLKQMLKDIAEYKLTAATNEMVVKVKPRVLFNPDFQNGVLPPDSKADFLLLDRVVNVCASHCVPFGFKGTIVGIKFDQERTADSTKYEVLFDCPFIGGLPLGDSCPSHLYTMLPFTLMNISYGTRLMTGKTTEKPVTKQRHDTRPAYNNRREDSRAPRGGGSHKPTDKKEIMRRTDDFKPDARKFGADSKRGGGRGASDYQARPPKKGAGPPPRTKQVSADDLSEDDHLNYREHKHSMRGRQNSYPTQSHQPAAPYMPPAGPVYPPVSPNFNSQVSPEYYGMSAAPAFPPYSSGYQQPYYNQGYPTQPQYTPQNQGFSPSPQQGFIPQQGFVPAQPFNFVPAFSPYGAPYMANTAVYMPPMGYNPPPNQPYLYTGSDQPPSRAPHNGKDRPPNKPRTKKERRQAELEYEGGFYHGDFYEKGPEQSSALTGDPYIDQPGYKGDTSPAIPPQTGDVNERTD